MAKFITKPRVAEAIQWDGKMSTLDSLNNTFTDYEFKMSELSPDNVTYSNGTGDTSYVKPGEWVVIVEGRKRIEVISGTLQFKHRFVPGCDCVGTHDSCKAIATPGDTFCSFCRSVRCDLP